MVVRGLHIEYEISSIYAMFIRMERTRSFNL